MHPCVPELGAYLEARENVETREEARVCVQDIYEQSTDYWVIKNMTHLLLDLDSNKHVFDSTRDNVFISYGYDFAEKLIFHPECVKEFDTKDALEYRCPMLFGKIILLKLKNANMLDRAHELYDTMKQYRWQGKRRTLEAGEAFPWENFLQTPQTYMRNLTAIPIWPESRRADLPIWDQLEDNFAVIKEETDALNSRSDADEVMGTAYPFLFSGGKWSQIVLYSGREWTKECYEIYPKTCKLFQEWLPARAVHHLPWTSNQNEQVIVLNMKPQTDVETHSGPGNNILNIHLGISGTKGAELIVANEKYGWEEGKVIAWDGSFDHRVHCHNCEQDRVVMLVRYMHPEVTWDHYRGSKRTHFEKIPIERQQDVIPEDPITFEETVITM